MRKYNDSYLEHRITISFSEGNIQRGKRLIQIKFHISLYHRYLDVNPRGQST